MKPSKNGVKSFSVKSAIAVLLNKEEHYFWNVKTWKFIIINYLEFYKAFSLCCFSGQISKIEEEKIVLITRVNELTEVVQQENKVEEQLDDVKKCSDVLEKRVTELEGILRDKDEHIRELNDTEKANIDLRDKVARLEDILDNKDKQLANATKERQKVQGEHSVVFFESYFIC